MKHIERVIIIGASSGIGHAVAEGLAAQGVRVGIAARRIERLEALAERYGSEHIAYRAMDVTRDDATAILDELIDEVGAPDILLYATGIGRQNPELDVTTELDTVATNCAGMVRIVDHFINYTKHSTAYDAKHKAHIAVITSVAGTMGIGVAPAYSATKSMQSAYLVALSQLARTERLPITLGDIRPGFVATEILNPAKHYPMMMSAQEASRHVIRSLRRRQRITTFDWRYRLLVALWRLIPCALWERLTVVRN